MDVWFVAEGVGWRGRGVVTAKTWKMKFLLWNKLFASCAQVVSGTLKVDMFFYTLLWKYAKIFNSDRQIEEHAFMETRRSS